MRRFLLAVPLVLTLGLAACDDDNEEFTASLNGPAEVPPNASTATGSSTFELDGTSVRYELKVNSITAVTAAHIHSGGAGVAGPVRVTLFSGPTTGATSGTLSQGTFTAADVQGITFDALLAELRTGAAYVNVHTSAYPAGEIRGQLSVK